jgi:hypothetical protein
MFRSGIPGIQEMYDLSQRLKALKKRVETEVERRLRVHFGFPERGKTLNNETVLFLIVKALCAPSEVLRNARPDFLDGLTLDVYVPESKLAIEYQGFQHFEPAEHLGGEKHFRQTLRRDQRKKKLCRENGLTLVEFDISDRLTEEDVARKISQSAPRD